ncbi:MAG: hypothetical protein EBT09_13720, partial [Actinobacteria bacterium]|nr:hypothetical protein [Actinomycetota bacterium]
FVVVGFAFKVSAVPFHTWAPDTYEGAPTPITGFLSVASKAAGFVALVTMLYVAFPQASDVWQPFMWVLAALTMTVGNVVALRQTNIVRMIAYSSISQGGFVLMPLAVAGMDGVANSALRAVVVYLIVYAATNLGMFAVIIAVSRKTRSGQIESFGGLFSYAPALGVMATVFLASLAGIPPLGGWIAKFGAFQALLTSGSGWGYGLAVIGAVNSVIAFGYYGVVMREIWMKPAPYGDTTPIRASRCTSVISRVSPVPSAADDLHAAILAAGGAIPFSEFMDIALYGPHGFYTTVGHAGRRGDFITSPEVGPLFGLILGNYLDAVWNDLGRPERFDVVEAGAGPGTLARSILAASLECRDALRYVAVETSEAQRQRHPNGIISTAEFPTEPIVGVVLANELLD